MKKLFTLVLVIGCMAPVQSLFSQTSAFNDYIEETLNSSDTIPDFEIKKEKLMITGTVYENDGVTPASDVILYMFQPDENGLYDLKRENGKRYVRHRGWVKTDANGNYAFYTFVPGNYLNNRELKHIHTMVKAPGKEEKALEALLFDNDPFLSKHCRKRLAKKGLENSILKLDKKESMFVAVNNIVLNSDIMQ
ncbi:MAG TPA: hypothetical protein PKL92_03140 [Aquaticitalea sp.]|nr:hypothetical protein [Aquaticitalea sp.]HNU59502.1 hypothetical protein [Aquaticitalea sp.]